MVDSVAVFPPGFRVTDADGAPVANAKIKFHDAGPGDPKTVYSDPSLGVLYALGTTVRTRSDGAPCIAYGDNTTTMIYVGADPYHIEITDEDDQVIFPAKDDVRGALDTSDFLTSADASTVRFPNVAVTAERTLGAADNGKTFNCDPTSSGTFTVQLDLTTELEDGWCAEIRHDGTANYVRLYATQEIYGPFGHRNAFSLQPGESVIIRCTGGAFKIVGYTPPFIHATTGSILIADRVSAAPSSPNPTQRYIATAIFTSGGITTAVGDIIEATGQGTFIKITPPSNCGWLAYVQDEQAWYQYQGSAWVSLSATQAQMETATSLSVYGTPGNLHHHPGVAKALALVTLSGSTATLTSGYGIASITRTSAGVYTLNYSFTFANTSYQTLAAFRNFAGGTAGTIQVTTIATTSCVINTYVCLSSSNTSLNSIDTSFCFAAYGTIAS